MPVSLSSLRAEAKRLKKAFAAEDPEATRRLRAVLPDKRTPRHADFLHVIARERGHESWPKLKFAIEAASMDRAQRAERLRRALYFGQAWVVEKLLGDDPDLASENLGLRVATYDVAALQAALARDPAIATTPIGPRTPILHLAFSHYVHMAPERRDAMLETAELLLSHGADPNDGYASEPGSEHKVSALYGALAHADNPILAEWLLAHGATPDDDESLYHATELGHTRGLELLLRHGARIAGTNALPRALDFEAVEPVRLLLEAGADPNEAVDGHPSGQPVDSIPALHQAARRGRSAEIAALLLDHGADPAASWQGHTAYVTALIHGNLAFAAALEARGHATPMTETEAVLAACARGETPTGRIDPATLNDDDRELLTRLVWCDVPLSHVRAVVEAGFDPDWKDAMALPPLHVAAWEGLPERLGYFLTLGPDLNYVNGYGGDALETALHGAEFCPQRNSRDHATCVRLLLEAGAELEPRLIDECGVEDLIPMLEDWAAR